MNVARSQTKCAVYLLTEERDDDLRPAITLGDDTILLQDSQGNAFQLALKHWEVLVEKIQVGDFGRPRRSN